MKKYRKGKFWHAAVILTVLAALQTPYNTGTYSLFFRLMATKRVNLLLPFVQFYLAGYVLLFGIEKARIKAVNRYQAQALSKIRLACVADALQSGRETAEVISFLDNDLKIVAEQYFGNIFQLVNRISIVIFTLCLTLGSNWIFALIYLALGMLPLKLTAVLSRRAGEKTGIYSDSAKRTTALIKDVIRNRGTLLNYNAAGEALKKVKNMVAQNEMCLAERNEQLANTNLLFGIIYTAVNIVPIAIGIYMGMKGWLSISAFVAVQYSSGWIVGSLGAVAGLIGGIKSTRPICERIEGLAEWEPVEAVECENVTTVEFKHVDFAYEPEKMILEDFSFCAKPRTRTLIQGESGSGKTTILKLISGELKPAGGEVLFNGKELLNRRIGYVSQSPAVFAETIRYNLTLGKDFSEEELQDAIERAGLSTFIAETGLDFILEEDGENISGGQKQRIEIARALLYDCSVLLVDEGTSALDEETAAKVHDTIMNLGKTVIEVAHYIPERVKNQFDRIIAL